MHSRHLSDLRASEVADRITGQAIFVLPVGAVEQHGDHLPLSTDLLIAESCAESVVAERGEELDLWLLPSLPYTKSNEHAWSPGTIWIGPQTMLALLDDIGRSIAKTQGRKIVFVNGHGGNTALLNVACRELRLCHGLMTFLMHPSVPPDHGGVAPADEEGMGIHSGKEETSMVLHLRPDLVDMNLATSNIPKWLGRNSQVKFGGEASFGWLSNDFGPSGVIGDPTGATADLGAELFTEAVRKLGEAMKEVASFEFPTVGG